MTVGQRIKEARKSKGISQAELGKRLGVSQAMIAQYEGNARNPKFETLYKISGALGVNLEDLLGDNSPGLFSLPIDSGMLATLEWYAKKNNRTVYKELDIAIDFYLNDLSAQGLLSDSSDKILEQDEKNIKYYENLLYLEDALQHLNDIGQEKAVERVEELTEIPKYQKKKDDQ